MPTKNVIFDSNEIYVVHQESDTDQIVVSFNEMGYQAGGDRFWGDVFFAKHKITSIGVVSKRPNWYPPNDMQKALEVITSVCEGRRVVTYGHSQGGYGAVKFSRKLAASAVIAFCPQWSINPVDVLPVDKRFHRYHRGLAMNGLRIEKDDVAANTYVIFDRNSTEDRFNAEKIAQHDGVVCVHVPFSGHATIRLIAQSGTAADLVKLFLEERSDYIKDIRQIMRRSRRDSITYHRNKFKYSNSRKSSLFLEQMRGTGLSEIEEAVDLALLYRTGAPDRFGQAVIEASDQTIEKFEILKLLQECRKYKLIDAEVRVAMYIKAHKQDNEFLCLHVINTFVAANMLQEAASELRAMVQTFGVSRSAVPVKRLAIKLGLQDIIDSIPL